MKALDDGGWKINQIYAGEKKTKIERERIIYARSCWNRHEEAA